MIKVGIIGSGFGVYGLLPAFSQIENCQVVAVCAKDTPRVRAALARYHQPKLYQDWRQMLAAAELDAVATAVTPLAQAEIGQAVLQSGKAWWAEKPLAATLAAAQTLVESARQHQSITVIDFIFPEIPAWQQAKKMLADNQLGELTTAQINWNFLSYDLRNAVTSWKTDPQQGGGALAFYFSHVLYYLEWLLGPITVQGARFRYSPLSLNGGETGVELQFAFGKNAQGTARIAIDDADKTEHQLHVTGSLGSLRLINTKDVTASFQLSSIDATGTESVWENTSPTASQDEDERVSIVQRLATRFITACQNRQQLVPSIYDGLRVQELLTHIRTLATNNHP